VLPGKHIMNLHTDKTQENKSRAVSHEIERRGGDVSLAQAVDSEQGITAPVSLQRMADSSSQSKRAAQLQAMADNYVLSQKHQLVQKEEAEQAATPETIQKQEPVTQLNKKGKGIGALIGGAIGAIGFLGGPVVGAITTALGAGLGAMVGEYVSGPDVVPLQAELDRRLRAADGTAKAGGALLFEQYIAASLANGTIDAANAANATALLRMAWALNQVSGYIMETIRWVRSAHVEKIMGAYINTVQGALGVNRQPWGGGDHAQYAANPAYFRALFSSTINYLNGTFPGMPAASRLRMLKSIQGWNHQKGTAQLAVDLQTQDYTPPAGKIVAAAEFVNNAFYDDGDYNATLVAVPAAGAIVADMQGNRWTVNGLVPTGVDLTPAP
jgi:outer membrane lipoprotein SlyB